MTGTSGGIKVVDPDKGKEGLRRCGIDLSNSMAKDGHSSPTTTMAATRSSR
jgi:hypothetical protein